MIARVSPTSVTVRVDGVASGSKRLRGWPLVAVLACCAFTFFAGLGATALWEPDEPRFAEATRQMIERGDFLTPWFNAAPRFEKPILLYWLQLPFFAALDNAEIAARAPAAICGLLTVLAICGIGRHFVSPRAGLLSALALATTFRFVVYSRQGLTDVPVTAAITGALWAMTLGISGRPSGFVWAAWALVGVGILLKGPVALLAPVIWTVWAGWTGGKAALARTRPFSGLLLASLVSAPWFVFMVSMHGWAFVDIALGYEVVARYVSDTFPGPDRGLLYYLGVAPGDGAPWSFFAAPAFAWAWLRRQTLRDGETHGMNLAAVWFTTVILVFSISEYKLPHYILPGFPGMALAVGIFLDAAIERRVSPWMWRAPLLVVAVALAAGAVLVSLLLSRAFGLQLWDRAFVLPILLAAGAVGLGLLSWSRGPMPAVSALIALLVSTYAVLAVVIAPRELRRFQPVPELAKVARLVAAPAEPLAVAGNYGAPGLVFYARRPVRQLASDAELVAFLSAAGRRHCVLPASVLVRVRPLVGRTLTVQASASLFSVRMRRLLESNPQRATSVIVLVTAEQ
jgi:4-amino-4-deoxy-L-arabinose transferase-like glycosyltransferase